MYLIENRLIEMLADAWSVGGDGDPH